MPKGIKGRSQCSFEGCISLSRRNGLCETHSKRKNRHGSAIIRKDGTTFPYVAPRGSGTLNGGGYRLIYVDGKQVLEHVYLAEKALGKKLPRGAVVHHMNEQPSDNYTPFNLVVCPNQMYHMLLHKRMREYNARNN